MAVLLRCRNVVSEMELDMVLLGWPPDTTDSPLWRLHTHRDEPDVLCGCQETDEHQDEDDP